MELLDIIERLRRGDSIGSIHRRLGVHKTIIREMRHLSLGRGWLDQSSHPPSEPEIIEARYGPQNQHKAHGLDPFKHELADYLAKGYSWVVMQNLIKDRYSCDESTLRRYMKRVFPKKQRAVMMRSTQAGKTMEVDFGELGLVWDPDEKRQRKAWVFSGRLRHSRLAWREVVFDQRQETFFQCHIHAFEYFGGVAQEVVPDNLKAAVIKASYEEPLMNRSYRDLARHYGFMISPCQPYTPRQKGGVENDIKYMAHQDLEWVIYRAPAG